MWPEEVSFLFPYVLQSSVKVPENKAWLSGTECGCMVLKLFPVLIPDVIQFLTLMRSIGTEKVGGPRGETNSNFDETLGYHTYACVFMSDRPIEIKCESLRGKEVITL